MLLRNVTVVTLLLALYPVTRASADIVDPDNSYVNVTFSQVYSGNWMPGQPYDYVTIAPDGNGETFAGTGITIEVFLRNPADDPLVGVPPHFIELYNPTLCICPGGNIADASTDLNGRTTFSGTIRGGGCAEGLDVYADGVLIGSIPVNINSPDLNGDCAVDDVDLNALTAVFGVPAAYDICFDFNETGPPTIDGSDLAFFANFSNTDCSGPISGMPKSFDAGGDGFSWHDGANWDPNGVPLAADAVTIGPSYNVVVSGGTRVALSVQCQGSLEISADSLSIAQTSLIEELTLSGGTLTGAGAVTVDSILTWTAGTIAGSGEFTLAASCVATLTPPAPITLRGRTLNNAGIMTWTLASIQLTAGAVFRNLAGGIFRPDSNINPIVGGTFINEGTVQKTFFSFSYFDTDFENMGFVDCQTGVAIFERTTTGSGHFNSTASGGIAFTGVGAVATLDSGSRISGGNVQVATASTVTVSGVYDPATTNISGGSLTITHTDTIPSLTMDSGSLSVMGNLWLPNFQGWGGGSVSATGSTSITAKAGGALLTGGTLLGPGATTLESGSTFSLVGPAEWVLDGCTLRNAGSIQWLSQPIEMRGGAQFENLGGGVFTVLLGDTILAEIGTETIVNAGTLNVSGTAVIEPIFTNSGNLNVSGTLQLLGPPAAQNAGTVELDAGSLIVAGDYVQTAGTTTLLGGATLTADLIDVQGGVLGGQGTCVGDVRNLAEITCPMAVPAESTCVLTVTGSYYQPSAGKLTIDLVPSGNDELVVGTQATLAGTLQVHLQGVTPVNGQTFDVIQYADRSGIFTALDLDSLSTGLSWFLDYGSTQLTLRTDAFNNGSSMRVSGGNVILSKVDVRHTLASDLGTATFGGSLFSAANLAAQPGDSLIYALLDPGSDPARIARFDARSLAFVDEFAFDAPATPVISLAVSPYATSHPDVVLTSGEGLAVLKLTGPDAGEFRGSALVFVPSFVGAQIDLLAYAPDGVLYGIESLGAGMGSRLWRIDRFRVAFLIGTTNTTIFGYDAATFLGDALWLYKSTTGDAVQISTIDATTIVSAGPNAFGYGLAPRACTTPTPTLVAQDVPFDAGRHVLLDWSAFSAPPGVIGYDIYRSQETCDLVQTVTQVPAASVSGATTQFVDTLATDYDIHFYRIDAIVSVAKTSPITSMLMVDQVAAQLFSGQAWSVPNVVINEFAPSGGVLKASTASTREPQNPTEEPAASILTGEKVELRNLSADPLDLSGFSLSNGSLSEALPDTILAGDGFFVHTLFSISLPDTGGTLELLAPDTSFIVDSVSYGSEGGAPSVPYGFTISRVDGTDATTPDSKSFSISASTLGDSNQAVSAELGSSILMNEIFYHGAAGQDYVELFNPLGTTVVLDQFVLGNGNNPLDTLRVGVSLAPGQIFAVDSRFGVPFASDITTTQMNLYRVTEDGLLQRVDQIGWGGGPDSTEGMALIRVPDGNAEYLGDQGTNWKDSGGGRSLRYGEPTPGQPNVVDRDSAVVVNLTPGVGDFDSIGAAIQSATLGTTIFVDPGEYAESIVLAFGVSVIGRPTPQQAVVIKGDGVHPIVTADNVDATTRLANVTLQSSDGLRGLEVTASAAVFQSVSWVDNATAYNGAGVQITGGAPEFVGCLFQNNVSDLDGGAVEVVSGAPVFRQCLFVGNVAQKGAVLYSAGGYPSFSQCTMDSNASSGSEGGAVHAAGDTVRVNYSVLTNSTAGASLRSNGVGTIEFNCGLLYNNALPIPSTDTNVTVIDSDVDLDPLYCNPAILDYAYSEASPLSARSAQCGVTIGVAGPPCGTRTSTELLVVPSRTRLLSALPNPFNAATTLRLELDRSSRVDLKIFDLRGRLVARLLRGAVLGTGRHDVVWRGLDVLGQQAPSGLYLTRLYVNDSPLDDRLKLILLK